MKNWKHQHSQHRFQLISSNKEHFQMFSSPFSTSTQTIAILQFDRTMKRTEILYEKKKKKNYIQGYNKIEQNKKTTTKK